MRTVIIRKRKLMVAALVLFGIAALFAGKFGDLPGRKKDTDSQAGSPVAAENFRLENGGALLKEKLQENPVKTVQETADFFVNYRLERDRARGQRVEWLREVINSAGTAEETRQRAQEHLLTISRCLEKEVELEHLIRAGGYDDAAVLVDERSVTVVVASAALQPEEKVRIAEMVAHSTGIDAQNILIIKKN